MWNLRWSVKFDRGFQVKQFTTKSQQHVFKFTIVTISITLATFEHPVAVTGFTGFKETNCFSMANTISKQPVPDSRWSGIHLYFTSRINYNVYIIIHHITFYKHADPLYLLKFTLNKQLCSKERSRFVKEKDFYTYCNCYEWFFILWIMSEFNIRSNLIHPLTVISKYD